MSDFGFAFAAPPPAPRPPLPPRTPMAWPPTLRSSQAITVLERALARQRLSHSLLITGEDLDTLVAVAHALADRLLNTPESSAFFAPEAHPDCLQLRPKGKMRIIPIGKLQSPEPGTIRDFLPKLYVTAAVSRQKVGILHEVERMNVESANAFLKTLEEPPANTTLLLLTTRPYALLPTIRSRCLHFRLPGMAAAFTPDGWSAWLSDYRAWLGRLAQGIPDKKAAADTLLAVYGLVSRFSTVLDFATGEAWKARKATLPAELTDEEQEAMETGLANGLRARLFIDIERATRDFALPHLQAGDAPTRRALTAAITLLEHDVGLLRLNLQVTAALENFLLGSLRLWARR